MTEVRANAGNINGAVPCVLQEKWFFNRSQ